MFTKLPTESVPTITQNMAAQRSAGLGLRSAGV